MGDDVASVRALGVVVVVRGRTMTSFWIISRLPTLVACFWMVLMATRWCASPPCASLWAPLRFLRPTRTVLKPPDPSSSPIS